VTEPVCRVGGQEVHEEVSDTAKDMGVIDPIYSSSYAIHKGENLCPSISPSYKGKKIQALPSKTSNFMLFSTKFPFLPVIIRPYFKKFQYMKNFKTQHM